MHTNVADNEQIRVRRTPLQKIAEIFMEITLVYLEFDYLSKVQTVQPKDTSGVAIRGRLGKTKAWEPQFLRLQVQSPSGVWELPQKLTHVYKFTVQLQKFAIYVNFHLLLPIFPKHISHRICAYLRIESGDGWRGHLPPWQR